MAKEKLSLIHLVLTGIIWTFVYLQGMSFLCYYVFDFDLLLLSDWKHIFHQFVSGLWVVNTFRDACLFGCLVLFIPMWLIGWWVCMRIRGFRFLPKFRTKRSISKKVMAEAQVKKAFVPTKLRIQSSALLGVNSVAVSSNHQGTSHEELHLNVPPAPTITYADEEDIQTLLPLVKELSSVDFFPHISLNGRYASFALSTEKKAAVVTLLNDPEARWSVDTSSSLEQSDWYSETRVLPTPLVGVSKIAEQLKEADEGAVAIPVMILMSGTILNVDEVKDYLDAQGIVLTRLDTVDLDDIPLFSDFLQMYFNEDEKSELDVSDDLEDDIDLFETEGAEEIENNWDETDEGIPEPEENA